MNLKYTNLIEKAIQARENSYSPFSNFKVGAALLTKNGKVYTGCNIEISSFSLTLCAERVAFAKAISEGETQFIAIAISTNKNKIFYPCGACLQFMAEFSKELKVILIGTKTKYEIHNLNKLLPKQFNL
ncbi:MAG: cytidine deaminase [Ignavibacteria bacterium]|nr:cytidine deaminase [Ignavibacteria bacterium]